MLVDKDEAGSPVTWNGILPAERLTPLFGNFDADGRPDPVGGSFGQGARYESCHIAGLQVPPGSVLRFIVASPAATAARSIATRRGSSPTSSTNAYPGARQPTATG